MEKATVYFTKEITPESLIRIYEALGRELHGKVAVKISTGEPGGRNFLQPQLIGPLVQKLEGTIVECRERGFAVLESQPDFLKNTVHFGSYDEEWSLRKVLRRFIWHDRIHAKAMYRMALKTFAPDVVPNIFQFDT